MIKVTATATRPSLDVNWNRTLTEEVIAHIRTAYMNTGKLLCNRTVVDGLTQKGIMIFSDQAAVDEWNNDPAFAARNAARNAYNQANNITIVIQTDTIDETDEDFLYYMGFLGFTDKNDNILPVDPFMKPA